MFEVTLIENLLTALLIGLIVGLEREIAQETRQDVKFAGLRTFGVVGLMGGICGYFMTTGSLVFMAALLAVTALTAVAYYRATEISKHLGFTTEMALLLTFLLGGLAIFQLTIAVILAIVVTVLLAFKEPLHKFTFKIPISEFYDSLKFAMIAIVILPILYTQFNQGYGPLSAFNPYQIWLIVVILSGISFVGYFLVKWFDTDLGLALTGIVGGMVSSTAVTTAMALRTKESKGIEYSAMTAATLSNTVMFVRVLFLIFIFYPGLVIDTYLPLGVMFVVAILAASYFYIKSRGNMKGEPIKLNTPFSIVPALMFGAFITAVLFISKAALTYLGSAGLYATSVIAALADVNAITVSTAQLAANGLASTNIAVIAIMLAVFVNLAVHILYAFYFGTRKFGFYTLAMASVVIASGAIVLLLV
ncbi:MAG TPA: MgtC/SapB family protein [Methanocellaceae archaeon]